MESWAIIFQKFENISCLGDALQFKDIWYKKALQLLGGKKAHLQEFSVNWMITVLDDGNQTKENSFYVLFKNNNEDYGECTRSD
ncbi:Hypothetical predicted protein [Olea europaea subsp. europaea]|uniref:Uncharacterized protein n=1 Tax=Olea europaea subsp. europaea TaxID=158383 RepID=A0A8S0RT77_OLEEU|nr:Hypothetical predicted protein [Olea europaea subsp. europaea]